MRLYIEGGDARAAHLKEIAAERGHRISEEGPWDFAVLSLPRTGISAEMAERLPPGQRVVCGMLSEMDEMLAREKGWRLFCVLGDGRYAWENAVLTAEGALYAAMRETAFALSRARCAVIGYGRIGKSLTDMLRGLGAQVTVAARRQESRAAAGPGSIPIEELPLHFPELQVLFNTVPARVIPAEWLKKMKRDALLIELASPPYGLDPAAAREMGLHMLIEGGVPGRYCPRSQAECLLAYLEREEKKS